MGRRWRVTRCPTAEHCPPAHLRCRLAGTPTPRLGRARVAVPVPTSPATRRGTPRRTKKLCSNPNSCEVAYLHPPTSFPFPLARAPPASRSIHPVRMPWTQRKAQRERRRNSEGKSRTPVASLEPREASTRDFPGATRPRRNPGLDLEVTTDRGLGVQAQPPEPARAARRAR